MSYSPTVIAASLSDAELKQSINDLVQYVGTKTGEMSQSFTDAVAKMKEQLKSLGSTSFGTGGGSDSSSSRMTKNQRELTTAVDGTTTSVEKLTSAMQKASESSDKQIFSTIDTQIAIFKEELKQAEKQVRSFTEMARGAAVSGDKGLFVFATKNLHEQEDSVARLKRQIEELTDKRAQLQKVTAPQGDAIKNFVQDLQKANPELQKLNEQYRKGTSLLQQQSKEQQNTTKDLGTIVDLTGKANLERIRAIDLENESKRATEMLNSVTAENLAFHQKINAERTKRESGKSSKTIEETNELRGAIAGLLNIEEKEIKNIDIEKASYNQLAAYLKQLQGAYNRLSGDLARGGYGKMFAEEMQKVQEAMSKISKVKSTPISHDSVFGIKPQTIDEINYKIRQLQLYQSGLNITSEKDKKEIQEVTKAIDELQKKKNELLGHNKTLLESNNALARSWNYMKNRLAFYFTVGASTQFLKNLIEIRAQYEMNERALGILVDSASRGTRIFNELSEMSLVSPYTLIELSSAAKQLTAFDIAAKDVVDTTRRLADMASAVGVPIERLTYALGQIKAYGYLNSRDARMFANAGIPLVKQLADYYTELEGKMISTADVYDRMKKRAISYSDVMNVVNKMTNEGGKFFDFQAKMADTLKVRLANLNLAWNNMLNDIGKDSNNVLTGTIKGLTTLFKHWREVSRIFGTLITTFGVYKTIQQITLMWGNKQVITLAHSFIAFVGTIDSGTAAMAALRSVMASIPFVGWATAIASVVSYFWLFNQSSDESIQKLKDIETAFDGIRNETTDLFVNAIKTDNIGTQLNKLRELIDLAESELNVVIPINLEEVNESNIREKLKEAKKVIDDYINFSQLFSEEAVGSNFNEGLNEFGTTARNVYTLITESVNNVILSLQKLADEGVASADEIKILNELIAGQKDDESRIEYLQRLIDLYSRLGLIGREIVQYSSVSPAAFASVPIRESNIGELEKTQEQALDRLGIKNREVFDNMLKDVQNYWTNSAVASDEIEKQVLRVAKKIDINNIPEDQKTLKLGAAINQEAALNNWNQFAKEYARWIANKKFGTTIRISDESKNAAENELGEWQQKMQQYADAHGIKFKVDFIANETEVDFVKRKLQEYQDAIDEVAIQERKLEIGTGSQEAVDTAKERVKEARDAYYLAGGDMAKLDKERTKQRKQAESELQKALKSELQLIEKVSSAYNELTKSGTTHFDAIKKSTEGFDESVANINKVLKKYGLEFDLSKFAGTQNPREIVDMLQHQINTLLTKAKPAEIQDLQVEVQKLNLKVETFNQKTLTDSLNNQLSKLKDEYELAVELDANPELGDLFTNMFGIDTSSFPHTISEYMQRVQDDFNNEIDKRGWNLSINVFKANAEVWKQWGDAIGLSKEALDQFKAKFVEAQGVAEKKVKDIITQTKQLEYELGDVSKKIEIEQDKLSKLYADLFKATQNDDVQSARLLELQIEKQEKVIENLKQESIKLLPFYKELFGDIYNASTKTLKGIVSRTKEVLATRNGDNGVGSVQRKNEKGKVVYDIFAKDENGEIKKTTVSLEEYIKMNKQVDSIQQKVAQSSPWEQIKDSFQKTKEGKIKNLGAGLQAIGGEVIKIGNIAKELGGFAEALGFDENTVEIINDVSTSITGMGTAVQGIGQIASGDYLGGIATTLSGVFSAISSWFDNSDKKIQSMIKDSELAVKRLEVSYKNLQNAEEDAFGTAVMGAQQAMKANRELQLVELKRQLALEQRRSGKHRDEERIASLRGEIIDLEHEIAKATLETFNNLADISSFGDLFQSMIDEMIDAFKQGEDAMKVFSEKWDAMIDSLVGKMIYQQIVSGLTKDLEKVTQGVIEKYTKNISKSIAETQQQIDYLRSMDEGDISEWIYENDNAWFNQILQNLGFSESFNATPYKRWWFDVAWNKGWLKQIADAYFQMLQNSLNVLNDESEKASLEATKELIPTLTEWANTIKEGGYLQDIFDRIQDIVTPSNDAQLSALQQGIQGITEDTAGALEAITNGISQQCYLQSDLLTQIRDAVIGFNMDASLGVQSQMLFELQQSYAVQMAIQNILAGWSSANGLAVKVEMV